MLPLILAVAVSVFHPVPSCQHGVVLACAVVVGVQSVHLVKLLAVVFEPLQSAVAAQVAHGESEGIVVRHLLHGAILSDDLADVAQVVLVEVLEGERQGVRRAAVGELYARRTTIVVVGYACEAAGAVHRQSPVVVVGEIAGAPLQVERGGGQDGGGLLLHGRQLVAVVGESQVVDEAKRPVLPQATAP